jgi:hypothetical protein
MRVTIQPVTTDDAGSTELSGALVLLATAVEQLLTLSERLLGIPGVRAGLSLQELADARSLVIVWREPLDVLQARMASGAVQPSDHPQ